MPQKENFGLYVLAGLLLSVAVLVSFQAYIQREPERIRTDLATDRLIDETAGRVLYVQNCAQCHGIGGEGLDAPALNDRSFLEQSSNERTFGLISVGIPGTEMPAWSQKHGGPFTDQHIWQIATFIRSWEPDAPDRQAEALLGDPSQGLTMYNGTCVVCHGEQGRGTERAPALNDPQKLAQFDDDWYADTIRDGRPSQGMPTWGTVLSPAQIRDLVALLRAWERGDLLESPELQEPLAEALHAIEEGDVHEAEHALRRAATLASGEPLAALNAAIAALEGGDLAAAEEILLGLRQILGDEEG